MPLYFWKAQRPRCTLLSGLTGNGFVALVSSLQGAPQLLIENCFDHQTSQGDVQHVGSCRCHRQLCCKRDFQKSESEKVLDQKAKSLSASCRRSIRMWVGDRTCQWWMDCSIGSAEYTQKVILLEDNHIIAVFDDKCHLMTVERGQGWSQLIMIIVDGDVGIHVWITVCLW